MDRQHQCDRFMKLHRPRKSRLVASLRPLDFYSTGQRDSELSVSTGFVFPVADKIALSFVTDSGTLVILLHQHLANCIGEALQPVSGRRNRKQSFYSGQRPSTDLDVIAASLAPAGTDTNLTLATLVGSVTVVLPASLAPRMGAGLRWPECRQPCPAWTPFPAGVGDAPKPAPSRHKNRNLDFVGRGPELTLPHSENKH
jgi:hypothetical protein